MPKQVVIALTTAMGLFVSSASLPLATSQEIQPEGIDLFEEMVSRASPWNNDIVEIKTVADGPVEAPLACGGYYQQAQCSDYGAKVTRNRNIVWYCPPGHNSGWNNCSNRYSSGPSTSGTVRVHHVREDNVYAWTGTCEFQSGADMGCFSSGKTSRSVELRVEGPALSFWWVEAWREAPSQVDPSAPEGVPPVDDS